MPPDPLADDDHWATRWAHIKRFHQVTRNLPPICVMSNCETSILHLKGMFMYQALFMKFTVEIKVIFLPGQSWITGVYERSNSICERQ